MIAIVAGNLLSGEIGWDRSVALINASNGKLVASLMLTAGAALAEAFNAYRLKAQTKGITQEMSADLDELKTKFDAAQAELQASLTASHKKQEAMQASIDQMAVRLHQANRTRIRWSIASFCLGLIPFSLKMAGIL